MGWLCDESMFAISINEGYVQIGYHSEQRKFAELNFENLKITLKSYDQEVDEQWVWKKYSIT